ncbi:hypothetical protein ALC53_06315 [Atta colombica]|uniref:Uncharacterized protein n=1 Tax=Atta colombica TaxID=520822 RepID=A0A195BFV6_9HYME|nr:hypothetical protein ALC53_06315 [Atta colombica]
MNEDWLAEPVCWGFGSVYRVALMSGGSRRLWNQLLRSAPSLSSSLAFSIYLRTRGFGLSPAFYYLYLPFIFLSLSLPPSFSLSLGFGYIRTPLLSYNLRQLSPTTNSIAEIEP